SLTKQKPWEVLGMSRAKWYRLGKPSGSETTPSPITCHGQMAAKSA
ncbi:replication protein, partial [Yersinia enterocolitica]|nr:replication protein [Yersinia enterocolitica]